MAGRKKLYEPELLKIGDRIQLKGERKKFANQYAYNWAKRLNVKKIDDWNFQSEKEGNNVFVKRVS